MTFPTQVLRVGEQELYSVSFADRLATGETLTGTPAVTVDPTPSPAELTSAFVALGSPATSLSLTADATTGVAGRVYRVNVRSETSNADRGLLSETIVIRVIA